MGADEKIDLLVNQYGTYKDIPNNVLYDLIQDLRENLVNMAKLGPDHIPGTNLGIEVRRRSQVDLRWLAQYFLWDALSASDGGSKPISENIFLDPQYDVFADLFIQKDPSTSIQDLSPVKTRVLLWPRGGAKSTYDCIDTVQWILDYPAVRILFLTAEASLSKGFISELKGVFSLRGETPTLINLFFPEFCCLLKDMGAGNVFTTPVYKKKKTGRKEPTVVASSVGKTKSGWHYEVIKADDSVSDKNTETLEQCVSVSEKLFLAEKLLIPGGYYKDYVGTRYAEEDHYGVLLEKYLTTGEIEIVSGVGWVLTKNKTYNIDILIGRACQIKPEVEEKLRREGRPVTYIEAGEDGCILLLPKKQPYSWLMGEYANNEKVFEGQLNQNPRLTGDKGFNRVSLIKATIPFNMLPRSGPVSQFWDLSFSQKKGADYCVGSSVMWGEEDVLDSLGKRTGFRKTVGYVRKIVRDRFNPFTVAQAIVQLVVEERPFILGIEDATGSKNLEPVIHAEAYKTGDAQVIAVCTHIQWVTPTNQYDAKHIRMGSLIPWIEEGRMKFANFCMEPKYHHLDVLYDEFERCLFTRRHGESTHHHDDIPDNLGYQPLYAPQATQAITENQTEKFYFVDRVGWADVFNPDMNTNAYYADENGKLVPWDAPMLPDDWAPQEDPRAGSQYADLPNVLGIGIFG
jgi:hypothetical protein